MKIGDFAYYEPLKTGYLTYDTNLGGIERGHFHEVSGRDDSGKSTWAQCIIANIQKTNPEFKIRYYDTEGNFDPAYAQACGIQNENFEFFVENDIVSVLSETLDFIKKENKTDTPTFTVIDSYAGFTHEDEKSKGVEKDTRQVQVRKLNIFLRLATVPLKANGSVVMILNQLRDKVDSMWGGTTTPGGWGLKHWVKSHIKLYDIASKQVKVGGAVIGHEVAFNVEKLKSLESYRGFSFNIPLIYGTGFSRELSLLRTGVDIGAINVRSSWYDIGGKKIQGEGAMLEEMIADPDFYDLVYSEVMG